MSKKNLRQTALNILMRVFVHHKPLDQNKDWAALDDGRTRQLILTCLRYALAFDHYIMAWSKDGKLPKSQEALILIRMGMCELLYMDTPDHAAVSSMMDLADANNLGKMKGFMNALLRRTARERPALDGINCIPAWLLGSWTADYGTENAQAIATQCLQEPPLDITDKATGETRRIHDHRGPVTKLDGFDTGDWWVQDFAASAPVKALKDVTGLNVLDICAAPGGKTMQLAARGANVTALDISEKRMERLMENLGRTELAAEIVIRDALQYEPEQKFDLILLDAPCSATGTLRRHPDLMHIKTPNSIESLVPLQKQILARAWEWVTPGGRLVYCTCSLQKAEGEMQIDHYRDHLITEQRLLPHQCPLEGGQDGFYFAVMQK